jgi:TolC family type I secretion outer membrane protein
VRDEAIVRLQKNNERLLKKQLDETVARFNVGEVTRTDVAQSRASYAQAQSDVVSAEGNLAISRANYMQIVGREPQNLQIPENLPSLFPKKFDDALDYAKQNNYALLASKKKLKAAEYTVSSKNGALLPEVTFNATTGKNIISGNHASNPDTRSTEYTLNMSVPLYQGGATRAAIRKSKYQKWQASEGVTEAERAVISGVTGNWQLMQANKSNIESIKEQIKASAIALEGTQKEEAVGNRTVLDVLNAYQTLLSSQVSEVTARHDYFVSGLQLLQSMGKLTAKKLALNVNYYNAEEHYQNTKGKWLTLSIDK